MVSSNNVTFVPTAHWPKKLALDPIRNKVYVAYDDDSSMAVIDGATNAVTDVPAGPMAKRVTVNPVTGKVYAVNESDARVTVIDAAPVSDTKVRAEFERLPGDTTAFIRPILAGKAVNRWAPNSTSHSRRAQSYRHCRAVVVPSDHNLPFRA